MSEQTAKSIRVVVVDDNGYKWHVDCAEATFKTLRGDEVVITEATEVMDE